jgi:hypothetical protein
MFPEVQLADSVSPCSFVSLDRSSFTHISDDILDWSIIKFKKESIKKVETDSYAYSLTSEPP